VDALRRNQLGRVVLSILLASLIIYTGYAGSGRIWPRVLFWAGLIGFLIWRIVDSSKDFRQAVGTLRADRRDRQASNRALALLKTNPEEARRLLAAQSEVMHREEADQRALLRSRAGADPLAAQAYCDLLREDLKAHQQVVRELAKGAGPSQASSATLAHLEAATAKIQADLHWAELQARQLPDH
jgi:hypothetical protein